MGAGNSAVVVDLPRYGPMLSPRVPNLVPIPGPRMERETPGQRPRPNYGHPQAAFLSRAFNLLAAPNPGFDDVPNGAWYASDVAKLAASGITVGCGDGTGFCPSRSTTRGQMATFLYRANQRAMRLQAAVDVLSSRQASSANTQNGVPILNFMSLRVYVGSGVVEGP